jgi:2-amino-4-hydroxy-6-hydroxymethyldihydropteridine diphosphokinase
MAPAQVAASCRSGGWAIASVSTPVAIALGSNVGNRGTHIDWAVSRLREVVDGLRVSTIRETEFIGSGTQPPFLNAVAVGHTGVAPRTLLEHLLALEVERGRVRSSAGPEPRTLDLDLILYGPMLVNQPELVIPHARFHERAFVLEPLAELVPDWIDPRSGKSIGELARALTSGQK